MASLNSKYIVQKTIVQIIQYLMSKLLNDRVTRSFTVLLPSISHPLNSSIKEKDQLAHWWLKQ